MTAPTLDEALDRAVAAYEAGDLEAARDAASVAVSLDRSSVEAHHFLAAALAGLGEVEQADRAYHEALALEPDDPELLLGAAELLVSDLADDADALSEAIELAARGAALAREDEDTDLAGELVLVEARAFIALGRSKTALHRLDEAERLLGDDADVGLHRGMALFELVRPDEAAKCFEAVLAREPDEPLAHHYLGLCLERLGDADGALAHLERARRLAPEEFPSPVTLSERAFDAVIESALERLPGRVREWLSNVAVLVEPLPLDEDLLDSDPPLSPLILGVFRGAPLGEKASEDPWAHFPSSIVLYQKNLERSCASREELVEEIEVTVLHEVGHYLGLDEAALTARGLE